MLSYLHQCAVAKLVVVDYRDSATGKMVETPDGGGYFTEVTLNPRVARKLPQLNGGDGLSTANGT
jgi:hypothetical protein